MHRIKFLFPILLFGLLQSCISNKKMVYLQDKSQDKPHQYDQTKILKSNSSVYTVDYGDILFIEILYQSIDNEQELKKSTIGERESRVAFSQHPYTSGYQVSDSGKISIEDIGEFEVKGKSVDEVRTLITNRANSYFLNPAVKVYLMNAYITVLGEVNSPGRFQFFDQMNVLEAIGIAGDMGEFADRESIKVLRPVNDTYSIYHINLTDELVVNSSQFNVLPGDVIMVKPLQRKRYSGRNIQWAISGLSIVVSVIAILTR